MTSSRDRANASLSYNGALVLQAIVQGRPYGFEIMRAARLPSGTVYPLLRRLERAGLVTSRWEEAAAARDKGRPPRRYYEPTPEGRVALAEALERVLAQQALFAGARLRPVGGGEG